MATLKNDLARHNLSLEDAIEMALNKPLWRLLAASGATHWWCMNNEWMNEWINSQLARVTVPLMRRCSRCNMTLPGNEEWQVQPHHDCNVSTRLTFNYTHTLAVRQYQSDSLLTMQWTSFINTMLTGIIFGVWFERQKVDKKQTYMKTEAHKLYSTILEYFEYLWQMSWKSILIISSYTVSKLVSF